MRCPACDDVVRERAGRHRGGHPGYLITMRGRALFGEGRRPAPAVSVVCFEQTQRWRRSMSTDIDLTEVPVPLSNTGMQTRTGVTTASLAELGARAGALGLEAHTVNRIVAGVQDAAHRSALDTLEK